MARIQPVLTPAELSLADQMAELKSCEELGSLARQLVEAEDPSEATRLREQLTRGFYGISDR
jgi:hypothetical protein